MPTTIPNPLPPWAKWAISIGATPNSYLVSFLTYLETMGHAQDPTPGEWRHIHLVFGNTLTQLKADQSIVTLDLANITGGGIDSSWTAGDYATTDAALETLVAAWMAHANAACNAIEFRYYRRAFNGYAEQKPFTVSGPPEHVHPFGYAGVNINLTPPQSAVTHTEITTYPRHWGRAYWPYPSSAQFETGGYLALASVDSWATAVHDAYQTLQNAEFFPCVPTTQVQGTPSRSLLGVTAVQVDNVADVVRRRRLRATTHKKLLPITP